MENCFCSAGAEGWGGEGAYGGGVGWDGWLRGGEGEGREWDGW